MFKGFYSLSNINFRHPFIAPPPKAEWYHKRMKTKKSPPILSESFKFSLNQGLIYRNDCRCAPKTIAIGAFCH